MPIDEILLNAAFYLFAIGAAVAAIAVATSKNIVRSAFSLLGVLFSVAAMYAFLRADFIVAAQIIIYVGGILVLIMFAVMLTHKITNVKLSNEAAPGPAAVFATLCMFFALVVVIAGWTWERGAAPERVAAGEGTGRAEAEVWLVQADGATGVDVTRGGAAWLDGAGVIKCAVTTAPAGATLARVELAHAPRKVDGTFGAFAPKSDFALTPADGAWSGQERYSGLPEGKYRWSIRFLKDNDQLPAALEGRPFTVEAGLTRPLGRALAGRHLLPFEVISVLLLAALVGAAYLARKEVRG